MGINGQSDIRCIKVASIACSGKVSRSRVFYLRAGEHFLDFSSLDELENICETLDMKNSRYENIQINGARHFEQNYSDQAIVRHIVTWF